MPVVNPNPAAPTRELYHQRTPEGEWLAWWSDDTEALEAEWLPSFGDVGGDGYGGAGDNTRGQSLAAPSAPAPQTFTVAPRLEGGGPSLSSAIGALLAATIEQAIKDAELADGALAMLPDGLADLMGGLADDPALMLEAKGSAVRSLHAAERRLRQHEGKPPGAEVELVSGARTNLLAASRADLARAYHVLQVCECLRIQAQQPRPVVVRLKTASMKPGTRTAAEQQPDPQKGITVNIEAPAELSDMLTRSAFNTALPLRRIRKRGE